MTSSTGSRGSAQSVDAFDKDLAAAARSLVVGEMPAALLDARPAVTGFRFQGALPLAAGMAIVVLAVGFLVGRDATTSASKPALRSASDIVLDLRGSGYACRSGDPSSPGHPRMEAIVCVATLRDGESTVIVSEDAGGHVGELHVRLSFAGAVPTTAGSNQDDLLERLIRLPFADPVVAGAAAHDWLAGVLPLNRGTAISTGIAGVPVELERFVGEDYSIVVGDLGLGGTAGPSR